MKRKIIKSNLILQILGVIILFFFTKYAIAATAPAITARPYKGTSELIFRCQSGAACELQEVEISMSNSTVRYEVRQEVLSILTSGKDNLDWKNFSIWGIRGTNQRGTFHLGGDAPGRDFYAVNPMYTSTADGQQDSFIIVYQLKVPVDAPSGSYRGRLRYILQPQESNQNQVHADLNVVVEIGQPTPEEESTPQIEIIPETGFDTISLDSLREDKNIFDVQFKVNRPVGEFFSISQVLTGALSSVEGKTLTDEAVQVDAYEVDKGIGIPATSLAMQRPQEIYKSEPNGDTGEGFIARYELKSSSQERAGKYTANLKYYLDRPGKPSLLLANFRIEVEIPRIFEFSLAPEDQRQEISFANLKPNEPPRVSKVSVQIKSNLGRQYQISQNVYSELTNKEGNKIPFKYFTVRTESVDTKGALRLPNKTAVSPGDTVLFISDNKGSADKFSLVYELEFPYGATGGDYSTKITYTMIEL